MKKIFQLACLLTPFLGLSQTTFENSSVKIKLPATSNPQAPTMAEKNPPLLVLDEVIYTFKDESEFQAKIKSLNADKIESMNVLKGQKATDEFGEKGANGVIIVKSKKK